MRRKGERRGVGGEASASHETRKVHDEEDEGEEPEEEKKGRRTQITNPANPTQLLRNKSGTVERLSASCGTITHDMKK